MADMWGIRFTFMAALESATEISTLSGAPQHALRGIYGTHKQFAIFVRLFFSFYFELLRILLFDEITLIGDIEVVILVMRLIFLFR
jgi:hypothetical protein